MTLIYFMQRVFFLKGKVAYCMSQALTTNGCFSVYLCEQYLGNLEHL